MKRKLLLSVLAAVLLAVFLPAAASAETAGTWSSGDITVAVPEGFPYILEPTTPTDDPAWAFAGVGDPASRLDTYRDMSVLAEFRSEDGKTGVMLMRQQSDESKRIYSLAALTEEEREKFLNSLGQAKEGVSLEKSFRDVNGFPFYRMKLDADTEKAKAHDVTCGTVVNGYSLVLEMYNGEKETTPEQLALFDSLLDAVRIDPILEKPEEETSNALLYLIILVLLVIVIVAPLVYLPIKKRKDKKAKEAMTERLSAYRRKHQEEDSLGDLRFSNATDCTKEAIHVFSLYQAYVKNAASLVVGAALCGLVLAAAFALDLVWWLKLIAVGVTVYFLYRTFNMPRSIEKVQTKVFQRGVSTVAKYSFYTGAFRVSGVQSASVYPYFQLTAVRRYRNYLYLYYGAENAYIIDLTGFTLGEPEEFEKFIRRKAE